MTGDLSAYRRMRDFTRTPEPAGDLGAGSDRPRFVVQRHRARRLHYDLRFEIGGVLASWAVPRAPTLDPAVRRLAVHVEDHPVEYLHFEGVIPSGEYGGGDVIVWDTGTWEPVHTTDPAAAVEAGDLHVEVHGAKLRGRLVLVRRGGSPGGAEEWMLRAVDLHRYPDGADRPGFWHKRLPRHAPDWLGRWDNPEAAPGETTTYLVANEPAALVWVANFGALEWHPWTSRVEAMHQPT